MGWSYQLAVHGLLGIQYGLAAVRVAPRIPNDSSGVDIRLRQNQAELHVLVERLEKGTSGNGTDLAIVIPAQAGIYSTIHMDSRLRGNDVF